MKAYTDIEQSKKLAKILPAESADMCWGRDDDTIEYDDKPYLNPYKDYIAKEYYIPCWSLAALLDLLPKHIKQDDKRIYRFHIVNDDGIVIKRWYCSYVTEDYHNRAEYLSDPTLKYPTNIYSNKHEDIIDACVEMIVKLKEKDLI